MQKAITTTYSCYMAITSENTILVYSKTVSNTVNIQSNSQQWLNEEFVIQQSNCFNKYIIHFFMFTYLHTWLHHLHRNRPHSDNHNVHLEVYTQRSRDTPESPHLCCSYPNIQPWNHNLTVTPHLQPVYQQITNTIFN